MQPWTHAQGLEMPWRRAVLHSLSGVAEVTEKLLSYNLGFPGL